MTKQEITTKLDEILSDSKKINFLNHLVLSYIPINKVEKVFDTPKEAFICVFTGDKLSSINEIIEKGQTEKFKKELFDGLKIALNDKTSSTTPIKNLIGDIKLGVTGEKTTTFMSVEVYLEFFDWVMTKSLNGDKHINWLLSGIRREGYLDRANQIDNDEIQNKFKKTEDKKHGATYSLGDVSDVLLKLKKQLLKK